MAKIFNNKTLERIDKMLEEDKKEDKKEEMEEMDPCERAIYIVNKFKQEHPWFGKEIKKEDLI